MTDGPSAWGIRPGVAWAEEVDAEEERNGPLAGDAEDFPTLGQAVNQPKKPKEKKKPQKMALGSFISSVGRAAPSDLEILAQLPKGSSGLPREERDPNALGGGFREYGGDRQGALSCLRARPSTGTSSRALQPLTQPVASICSRLTGMGSVRGLPAASTIAVWRLCCAGLPRPAFGPRFRMIDA